MGHDDERARGVERPWWPRVLAAALLLLAVTGCSTGSDDPDGPAERAADETTAPDEAAQVDEARSEDVCATPAVDGHGFDRYGGWKGLHQEGTGRFTVGQVDDRWWLFTPDGNAFYASGPTGIDPDGDAIGTTDRNPYREAALARHGSEEAWAEATVDRLCDLGVRALGGWLREDAPDLLAGFPYAVNMDVYAAQAPVDTPLPGVKDRTDVFAADAPERAEAATQAPLVARCVDDPWCIGVYVENEAPYAPALLSSGTHLDVYLTEPAGAPGKVEAQRFLEERYDGDVTAFNATWGTDLAGWDDLQALTALGECAALDLYFDDLCLIAGPRARLDDQLEFEAHVAGRVAELADEALAAADPDVLNLGPRLVVAPYAPSLLRAVSAPADVVSVNNYDVQDFAESLLDDPTRAAMAEMDLLSFDPMARLDQVAEVTGKPVLVSEWFYRQARPGVATHPEFLPERPDAADRAEAVGEYLDGLLARPSVVGDAWFQWQDQPVEGRRDGENQLIGIVDIADDLNQPLADTLGERYRAAIEVRRG